MALEIGSRLGHYDVTALIGEGGMGQVYQATDTTLDRDVAIGSRRRTHRAAPALGQAGAAAPRPQSRTTS